MSFSKAKIQRFNDVKDCTPSPAKYNVATQDKIKLGIISQSGIYMKKPGSCSGSETGSVHSTPIFQTPTVPKKKKFLGLSTFNKTKANDCQEELREKIVECSNKDMYIRDLTEQIDEMKAKIVMLEHEKSELSKGKEEIEEKTSWLRNHQNEIYLKHVKLYEQIKVLNDEMRKMRQENENLKSHTRSEVENLLQYINRFQDLHDKTVKESQEDMVKREEKMRNEHKKEIEDLKKRLKKEVEEANTELEKSEAKIKLLEENFNEVTLFSEIQTKEKIKEIEDIWKIKLEEKEKESEAILKECQEISEYNIIQSEVEKNQLKNLLEEKTANYEEILEQHNILEDNYNKMNEEIINLKNEKHAYELSITTFRDTIEVLKKRLINSDRDVEQLKEELEKYEEKILQYEKKITELTHQLNETQVANEELEMQYESTSKIMQNEVATVERSLLDKVGGLEAELKQLLKDRLLLNEILEQYHAQQSLLNKAQETIAQSSVLIEAQEKKNEELEEKLQDALNKLAQEAEEAAEIRKKYIEKSGKFDELSQQFVEAIEDLRKTKLKNEELVNLVGPYQEQLEAYDHELKVIMNEKQTIENEAKDLTNKYAEILGHQNHKQKIKHLNDLKLKSSELFEKNMDLESKNYKLNKLVDKLKKEIEDMKKSGKKIKLGSEDKENMASPKCLKSVQSPGPLKEKN